MGSFPFDRPHALPGQGGTRISFGQHAQTVKREVRIDVPDDGGALRHQGREAAGGQHLHVMPVLGLHPRHQPLDHRDIPPVDAGLHRRDRIAPDHRLRPPDADARQPGRGAMQSLNRQVDPRRDDAAQIRPVVIRHIERGRGAEIDHHQRPTIIAMPGQRIEQPIGADFLGVIHLDLEPKAEPASARV